MEVAIHQRCCKTYSADGRVSSERNCQSPFTMDRKMVFVFVRPSGAVLVDSPDTSYDGLSLVRDFVE